MPEKATQKEKIHNHFLSLKMQFSSSEVETKLDGK